MFEKEAEESANQNCPVPLNWNEIDIAKQGGYRKGFKDGAEFGYNKANEWHYVKDGDFPKEDLRQRTYGYYLTALKHKSYKGFVFEVAYFTGVIFTKGGDILDNVYAWKEIVPPKE